MTETNAADQVIQQPVTVSMGKLIEGIGKVFSGILTMLESLDASSRKSLIEKVMPKVNTSEIEEDRNDAAKTAEDGADPDSAAPAVPDDSAEHAAPSVNDSSDSIVQPEEPENPTAPTVPTVSLDDIAKIIVKKIKQNRSNNEKIAGILKTYGAAKVSDLPVSKYEAFLTDLSAI